jgi:hypothetical protein
VLERRDEEPIRFLLIVVYKKSKMWPDWLDKSLTSQIPVSFT